MILNDMPEREYHAHAALSSTGARQILDSPARFRYMQDHPQGHKDAFDLGTSLHSKVLGVGSNVITYPPEHLTPSGAASTKAATVAWAEEQRATGNVIISQVQASLVDAMAEACLAHPEGRSILETIAGREVSIFADVDGVPIRARFDLYDGTKGGDLKTARDASPKGFNRSVGAYGYHIQEQWYRTAHTAVAGAELEEFKFLVVETSAPHLVGVYDLDFMWEDIAKQQTQHALELYLRCTETDTWPGYLSGTLTPPTWAVYENEEQEISV